MSLSSLVVCPDESTAQLLCHILQELGIAVEHCSTGLEALARLERKHFDSILIDCKIETEAAEVLRAPRSSPRNAKSLTIAIAGKENNVRQMFVLGINFVLYK